MKSTFKLKLISIATLSILSTKFGIISAHAQSINDAARQSQLDITRQQQLLQLQQQQNQLKNSASDDFDFKLQRTDKTPVKKSIDELGFILKEIVIEGNSVFDQAQVNKSFEKHIGKTTTLSDINEDVADLEERYRKEGYFLTKVYVPPQTIENGILKIAVIEGYINKVNVEGGSEAMQARVKEVSQKIVDKKPLDLHSIESILLVLNAFPGYEVTSVLRQGSEPNSSELFVNVRELPDSYIGSINNNAGYSTGPWGISLNGLNNHIFGRDNQLTYGYNGSLGDSLDDYKRLMSFTAKYAEPIGNSGLVGSVSILKSQSNPKASLTPLNLQTDGQTIGLRLAYPLYKSRGNSLSLESGLAFNRTTTTTNSAPLTFDKSTVFDVNLAWINNRAFSGVNVMNFGISKGVPGGNSLEQGDPTASTVGFNPQFSKLTFNWLRIQQIAPSWSASLYMNGQYTNDNLLVGDTIVFGGIPVGRGYDNGSISGDKGLGSSIEIRKDLNINLPYTTSPLQLFSFYDYGTAVTNYNATTGAPEKSKYIQSYGFGARTTFPKGTIELQYAIADLPVTSPDPRPNPRVLLLANYFF